MKRFLIVCILMLLPVLPALAAEQVVVRINLVSETGIGASIGTVTLSDTPAGLNLALDLKGLPPGTHGFHVHEKPDCGAMVKDGKPVAGLAAGGHYDPHKAGKHEGHSGQGHLGDLPALTVDGSGKATTAVTAPRLKLADVKGRSLMVHAGGDTYSDTPAPLGGGGARIACGVIP